MIENEMMFGSQLPGADLEAKPKAKAGTPIVRITIPIPIAVVGAIIGSVTVTVAIVGAVVRTIAVAVSAVSITDILYRARLLSICQR
jgi:hypothetical protein